MKYKNVSPFNYVIPNVGEVEAGGVIESAVKLENPNLVLVADEAPVAPMAPAVPPVTATVVPPPEVKETQ